MEKVKMAIKECPSCGAEIKPSYSEEWLSLMEDSIDKKEIICSHCGVSLSANKDTDDNEMQTDEKKIAKTNRKSTYKFLAVLLSLVLLMLLLNSTFEVLNWKNDKGNILYIIVWLFIISAWLSSGTKLKKQLKHASIWIGLFLILLAGFSYRVELLQIKDRILSNLVPEYGLTERQGSMSFVIASDGHFYVRATVDDFPIRFLVDTGASHIVLSPADARKLGIETDELIFDRFYETANGTVRGCSIRIGDLRIGDIHLKEIGASVNEAEMRHSLLGMTFFRRLKSYEVKNDVLTLYWSE
jgi:aspartyl protease family protein